MYSFTIPTNKQSLHLVRLYSLSSSHHHHFVHLEHHPLSTPQIAYTLIDLSSIYTTHSPTSVPSRVVKLKVRQFTPKPSPLRQITTTFRGDDTKMTDFDKDTVNKDSPDIKESLKVNDTIKIRKHMMEFMESIEIENRLRS